MPSFELSKLQGVTGPRALSNTDRTAIEARIPQASSDDGSTARGSGVSLEIGALVNTATPPVNTDRVAQIRDALRDGNYPLVPAEIADAMIAAQLGFGIAR